MQVLAELLRCLLISEQIALILWMLTSDLWRRLPIWVLWLTAECISRILFTPGGNYWHMLWRPMQPALLFLLAAAAIEARYHAGESTDAIAFAALLIAPIGIGLHLGEIIQLRIGLCAGVAILRHAMVADPMRLSGGILRGVRGLDLVIDENGGIMTIQRFQGIVLKLGNQMFVRHYLWINYPHDPQLMGIELIGQAEKGSARKATCECGTCPKCRHREYMRGYRPKGRLAVELAEEGFAFNDKLGIWTITRSGAEPAIDA